MARSSRRHHNLSSQSRPTPYPLPSEHKEVHKTECNLRKPSRDVNKDWEDATCSVCMEFPHNAVLLLCSSHDKGCRPYMCGTNCHYSNCLDQYKKAYTKVTSSAENQTINSASYFPLREKSEVAELACPLCRGQVKGWTVVEPARDYLNAKKRSCMQDDCSFVGTYKELRKHVKAKHPLVKPRKVDPVLEQKWRNLEHERDREDVISTIRSSMPGAMVLGDYVIENNGRFNAGSETLFGEDGYERGTAIDENFFDFLFLLQSFRDPGNASFSSRLRRAQSNYRFLEGDWQERGSGAVPTGATEVPLHANSETDGGHDASANRQGRAGGPRMMTGRLCPLGRTRHRFRDGLP